MGQTEGNHAILQGRYDSRPDGDSRHRYYRFGTDRYNHRDFKQKYRLSSNWNGENHEFPSLKKVREAAAKEVGITIWIHTNFPYGRPSKIACKAEASGITPP